MKYPEGHRGARRTQAREGDECRRVLKQDKSAGSVQVCRKPLPPGTLPYAAHNSGTGKYLMLCTDCRQEHEEVNKNFLAAEVYSERLEGSFTQLREGKLISEEEMKDILQEREDQPRKRGPLSRPNRVRAVSYAYGEEESGWLAGQYYNLPSL
jgi:hypothetical protein